MLQNLLALFDAGPRVKTEDDGSALGRAAAVLMAIEAGMDGTTTPAERAVICRLLQQHFAVTDAEAMLADAEREAAASTDFYAVTRIIKDGLSPDERIAVIEMLWEVALADDVVGDHESNLVRRVAGLLYVADRDAGEARRRVTERRAAAKLPSD